MSILIAITGVVSVALLLVLLLRLPRGFDDGELRRSIADEAVRSREEARASAASLRQEVTSLVGALTTAQRQDLERVRAQVESLTASNEQRIADVRRVVDERLKEIAATNERALQEMRTTVDEKLQGTLNQRLGESFALVTQRLEEVHRGLGEMQSIASNVGDLKKVFSNVKIRGGWGEVQLESLLEQMLSPEQYERNVCTKEETREVVEFAVKFPGRGEEPLLLPIDAKFPLDDYQQLVDAHDAGDLAVVEAAGRRLETSVRNSAKGIHDKYLNPPRTTDFAILFLPTEGLFAEIVRRPGLADRIQSDFRILVAGPTTLAAILSSLQMGFRTLAIEKRSSEVWRVLEAVKTEFLKFGGVIERVNKNLDTARNQMDSLATRSRAVTRRLRDVQELPESDAKLLLKLAPSDPPLEPDDDDEAWVEARP
jgi:DNA recombination protein RmuC